MLYQQQERDAYQLAVRARAHTALDLRATETGDQQVVDLMTSAVADMLTGSAMSALGRRTIVMGISKSWITAAVQPAASRRRAATRLMLCRPYDAAARGGMAAANQEFTAAVRDALRAHRSKLEYTRVPAAAVCPRARSSCTNCWNAWQLLPAARGYPHCATLTRGHHAPQMKAAALAAVTAAIAQAREPATQEESASVA